MSSTNAHWRIKPTPYVEHHVQRIAAAEARSLSNTLHKLLTEAIDARRSTGADVERIVRALTTPSDTESVR